MPSIPLASVTLRMVDQMKVTHCPSQSGILGVLKRILRSDRWIAFTYSSKNAFLRKTSHHGYPQNRQPPHAREKRETHRQPIQQHGRHRNRRIQGRVKVHRRAAQQDPRHDPKPRVQASWARNVLLPHMPRGLLSHQHARRVHRVVQERLQSPGRLFRTCRGLASFGELLGGP
jgi:hypothetical protein